MTTAPLIQIRRGYTTACCELELSVQTDVAGWTAQVTDRHNGSTLYAARRCSLDAAKVAAAEFAASRAAGPSVWQSPEAMARHLSWREYW